MVVKKRYWKGNDFQGRFERTDRGSMMDRNMELVPGRIRRRRRRSRRKWEILDRKKKQRKAGRNQKNLQCLHGIKLLKVIILSISLKKWNQRFSSKNSAVTEMSTWNFYWVLWKKREKKRASLKLFGDTAYPGNQFQVVFYLLVNAKPIICVVDPRLICSLYVFVCIMCRAVCSVHNTSVLNKHNVTTK